MYGMLRRTFKHLDEKTFVPLYKTMARSQFKNKNNNNFISEINYFSRKNINF